MHTLPTLTKMYSPHFMHPSGINPSLIFDATNVRRLGVCVVHVNSFTLDEWALIKTSPYKVEGNSFQMKSTRLIQGL